MNANETGIMAELKHESLIVFYDKFYYENTNFCILMEFCEVYIFTFKNLIADFIMNCKREAIWENKSTKKSTTKIITMMTTFLSGVIN